MVLYLDLQLGIEKKITHTKDILRPCALPLIQTLEEEEEEERKGQAL